MKDEMRSTFYKWIRDNNILKQSVMYDYWSKHTKSFKKGDYSLESIISFWSEGDNYYATAICNKILDSIKDSIIKGRTDELSNAQSAFRKIKLFLLIGPRTSNPKAQTNETNNLRKKIRKNDLPKIDGNIPLLKKLSVDEFIRLAVESSYFFSKGIIAERNSNLRELLTDKAPARKSEDGNLQKEVEGELVFEENGFRCKIDKDSDNNKEVRSLINKYSGYTVSQGKNSIFRNYIISHIWGRAYDPRFFTSFWNIVLIPTWANFLMDDEYAEEGSLESKMQSTFRAICKYLYCDCVSDLIDVGSHMSIKDTDQYKDRIQGEYEINVIHLKTDKDFKVASIKIEPSQI